MRSSYTWVQAPAQGSLILPQCSYKQPPGLWLLPLILTSPMTARCCTIQTQSRQEVELQLLGPAVGMGFPGKSHCSICPAVSGQQAPSSQHGPFPMPCGLVT